MRKAVIVDVVRTAVAKGKVGGALSGIHPVDLLAQTLQALQERNGLDAATVDDVIAGCVTQVGEQALNIGRRAVLAAGWPDSVPATTIDRQCGSGQQSVHFAAQGVVSGAYDIVIACGVESMSRIPMGSSVSGADLSGVALGRRYPEGLVNQGIAAELIAEKWAMSRADLDAYSARSHSLAAKAQQGGGFDNEIISIVDPADEDRPRHVTDETVRSSTSVSGLAGLAPAFATDAARVRFPEMDWKITAGNSSPVTDGAAAALIMEAGVAARLGLIPRAAFSAFSVVGSDPYLMLTGPIPATEKVLARAGMRIGDVDAFEVNEAFAPVPLAWASALGADLDRVNPRGGAIALGHPIGASGVRILATMLNHLEQTDAATALQTMCEGGGLANAMIIERL